MRKIKAEIAQYMTGLESAERMVTSRFVFPDGFIGFDGHFPHKKILPGVCQIQCALTTIAKARNCGFSLKEVVLAKYFAPVGPDEEIVCVCSDVEASTQFTFKAAITKGTGRIAEFKLRVAAAGTEQPDHKS